MGPGCSNLPWALDRGEWPACMCISGWACSTWPHPPRMHYGEPSALSASSLGCLADLQPDWLCPVAALAQLRWSVDTQEHRDARESSWGALWPAQSHTLLSALTLLADSIHPGKCGQVFPTSSWSSSQRFLNSSDARWRNNSSVKGKSPWGTELLGMWQALPLNTRVACRPSWAAEGWLPCLCGLCKAGEEGLEHAWSCMGVAVNGSAT